MYGILYSDKLNAYEKAWKETHQASTDKSVMERMKATRTHTHIHILLRQLNIFF